MRYDYRYDAEGRLKEKRASGRILTGYTYDAEGNKVSQKDLTGKILAEYVYSASGNPVVKKIGGNITSTYAYDELLNIKALKTETEKQTLADNHYFYDGNGNQIRREGLEGTTGYAYDGRNRLTEISYPSALGGYTEKLGYDAAGNRIRRETEQEITTYRYDNCNRLQELRRKYKNAETSTAQPQIIRYTYDRQGNMLSEGEKKYSYDSFGRMVRAEVPVEHRGASNQPDEHAGFSNAAQSTGETFGIQENSSATREFQVQINRYDGEGLRHEMEENGRLIKFLYNEDREVVAEETGNGTITRYIRGLGIISSDSEEAKTYYHYVSDEQGSITHVLSEDAEILNHYSYDAFGNIIEKTEKVENRFCYNGEMLDPVTQQYYLRARFYNPVIGRFTQEDTYYGDGLNLYQYCQANPVGYVDPSGHTCEIVQNHYEQYQEYRKQHSEANAAKAYEAVTGKDPLKKDGNKGGTPTFKYKKVKTFTAEETNQWFIDNVKPDYKPPYKPGTIVNEIELTENTSFVRVYDNMPDGSGMYGSWVMKAEDIEGLTPLEIQNKFALPNTPKYVCDVELEAGTHIREGEVNPLEGWGSGGGTQYDLIGQRIGNFKNERLLEGN